MDRQKCQFGQIGHFSVVFYGHSLVINTQQNLMYIDRQASLQRTDQPAEQQDLFLQQLETIDSNSSDNSFDEARDMVEENFYQHVDKQLPGFPKLIIGSQNENEQLTGYVTRTDLSQVANSPPLDLVFQHILTSTAAEGSQNSPINEALQAEFERITLHPKLSVFLFRASYEKRIQMEGKIMIQMVSFNCNWIDHLRQWAKKHRFKPAYTWTHENRLPQLFSSYSNMIILLDDVFQALRLAFQQYSELCEHRQQRFCFDKFKVYYRAWSRSCMGFIRLQEGSEATCFISEDFNQFYILGQYLSRLMEITQTQPIQMSDKVQTELIQIYLRSNKDHLNQKLSLLKNKNTTILSPSKSLMLNRLNKFYKEQHLFIQLLANKYEFSCLVNLGLNNDDLSTCEKYELSINAVMKMRSVLDERKRQFWGRQFLDNLRERSQELPDSFDRHKELVQCTFAHRKQEIIQFVRNVRVYSKSRPLPYWYQSK